jgi:hypothetical protein
VATNPITGLRAVPLPSFGIGGHPTTVASPNNALRINPRYQHDDVPLPSFVIGGTLPPPFPGVWTLLPIKPLPQGAGGGGPVGTPIDSG